MLSYEAHRIDEGRFPIVNSFFRLGANAVAVDESPVNPRLEKRLKDYASGGLCLLWKRQSMYLVATLLAGAYIDAWLAVVCLIACELSEWLDYKVSTEVVNWENGTQLEAHQLQRRLLLASTLSSLSVAAFCVGFALLEGPIPHQLPLFILFAAGLFAAVNNHQLPQILYARLFIYGFSFLFIPIYDLIVVRPPLASLLWLQLATVLFVLYFVIECAQIFLQIYRKGLDQLDALRQERDSARSAYKVKSQFVSIISHELRTPLTSIAGSLDLLHSGAFEHSPEKSRRVLDIARKNSNRLRVLIDDLLDFQKLETSGLKHTFQSLDLNQLVRDVMMSMVPAAEKKEVSLVAALSDRPLPVVADRDRLMQLFFNLLSNAIKFSKGPSDVTVKTWVERGCVYTAIEDHGIGIPEGSEELVFSQFGQVDSSDHRQHEGTGLGLTIVRQITEAHNGSIQYSSVLNAGTTFTLRLPLSGKEQKSTFRDD